MFDSDDTPELVVEIGNARAVAVRLPREPPRRLIVGVLEIGIAFAIRNGRKPTQRIISKLLYCAIERRPSCQAPASVVGEHETTSRGIRDLRQPVGGIVLHRHSTGLAVSCRRHIAVRII